MPDMYHPNLNAAGYSIIDGYVHAEYDQIRDLVAEGLDIYLNGYMPNISDTYLIFVRNLLKGYDSAKADQPNVVSTALKSIAASQFIVTAALPHTPEIQIARTLDRHIDEPIPSENKYLRLFQEFESVLDSSRYFKSLLYESYPSIDPNCTEPGIVSLFGGFTLLALGIGEEIRAQKIKEEMEAEASTIELHNGDIMSFFDS